VGEHLTQCIFPAIVGEGVQTKWNAPARKEKKRKLE